MVLAGGGHTRRSSRSGVRPVHVELRRRLPPDGQLRPAANRPRRSRAGARSGRARRSLGGGASGPGRHRRAADGGFASVSDARRALVHRGRPAVRVHGRARARAADVGGVGRHARRLAARLARRALVLVPRRSRPRSAARAQVKIGWAGDKVTTRKRSRIMARGFIRGTHHLTFCVGGAQEDYDFHVRVLGLKSVKKTVLFDGEIPIYHLYYGNRLGEASTLLTAFPYRQAGWMGKRGTNQMKILNLSIPADALGYWADRRGGAGIDLQQLDLFGTERLVFTHPGGIPHALVADPGPDD